MLIAFTVALTFAGCNRKTIYSHYEPTPIEGWDKNDTLYFMVAPIYHDDAYCETIGLRISSAYPFQNLSLIVEQYTRLSGMKAKDTLNVELSDDRGTMKGDGINYFQYECALCDVNLLRDDTLFFKIRHNMKREMLPGVSDVGVKVTQREQHSAQHRF